ncbi:MAG: permease prefix domain 1-containing protein [Peptostreptococcaceae bacterium]|nr:permease prefix domain 1-containing protein [Peptostreptococcaceae bacterium]
MDTIKSYIENLFVNLPKTAEILKAKEDLLQMMEDKYNEEKARGRSENEAIGIVISEFGNIDEILQEIEISTPESPTNFEELNESTIQSFISSTKSYGKKIALGIMLCIAAPALAVIGDFYNDYIENLFIFAMMLVYGIAVMIFIVSGTKHKKYKYIERGEFEINRQKQIEIRNLLEAASSKAVIVYAVSLFIIILSIGSSVIFEDSFYEDFSNASILLAISIAVFMIIATSYSVKPYKVLLKREIESYDDEDGSPESKHKSKVLAAVASVVFPLGSAFYILISFLTNRWDRTWVIFPVLGICYGAFAASYSILKKQE